MNTTEKTTASITLFEPDDAKYLKWVNEHPEGFILTSNKSLYPKFTVIHKSTCDKIKILKAPAKPGGFTERDYIKVYSTNLTDLNTWVLQKRVNGSSRKCSLCF
jgi:hypothetical protein